MALLFLFCLSVYIALAKDQAGRTQETQLPLPLGAGIKGLILILKVGGAGSPLKPAIVTCFNPKHL